MTVRVRRVEDTDADGRALAALRRAWDEEDAGGPIDDPSFEDRAVPFYERHGFVPADLLYRTLG